MKTFIEELNEEIKFIKNQHWIIGAWFVFMIFIGILAFFGIIYGLFLIF